MVNSILIKNAEWVVTQNPKRDILKNKSIYIKGNEIVEIGNPKTKADVVIDGKNKLVMPGLINTHTHLGMTILRGYLDDMELHEWLKKSWAVESKLTKEDVYYSSLIGCIEMIKNGITIFNDMYYFGDSVLRAVDESGMRGMFSQAILDTPVLEFKNVDESFKVLNKLEKKWRKNERTLLSIGPHAIYTCSKETLLKTKEFADKNNLLIHTHLSETEKEVNDCYKKTGKGTAEYLDSIGFLSKNVIAAHCCWLVEEETKLLKKHDVKVSHCPVSNLKTTAGIAPVPEMLRYGLCVSLGTDSAASNNSLDLFQEMKFAALLHKNNTDNPTVVPAQQALDLATVNGARTLGLEKKIGSLEAGKKADVIILDIKKANMMPIVSKQSVVSHLVYSVTGKDVETVIVDGKIIMRDRKVLTLDEEKVYDKTNKIISELLK